MPAIAPVADAWKGVFDLFTALLALIQAIPLAAFAIVIAPSIALLLITRAATRKKRRSITHRVFISSTSLDLAAHRKTVHDTLERMYQYPVDMAQFGAGGADPTTISLRELASAEFVVLIIAWRYGFIPKSGTRSITQLEYEEALRLGRPVFVYLADPTTETDTGPTALFPAATRDDEHATQLATFRALLADSNRSTYDTFTTPDNLAWKVASALARRLLSDAQIAARGATTLINSEAILAGVARLERRQAADLTRTAPTTDSALSLAGGGSVPRAIGFVGRAEELRSLRESLTRGESIGVFALEGMAGVGKSALAAVAFSEFVQDTTAFPGRGAWVSCDNLLGPEGLAELWSRVARVLGYGEIAALADNELRRVALASALAVCPRMLLVLDNVEPGLDAAAALDTLAIPGHITILLTAREKIASHRLQASQLPPLPDLEAERLLRERLTLLDPTRPTSEDDLLIPALVEAVGGLPLAVESLASYAAGGQLSLATLAAELAHDGVNAAAFRLDSKRALTTHFARSLSALSLRQQALFAGLSLLAGPSFPRATALALDQAAAQVTGQAPRGDGVSDSGVDLATLIYFALVEPMAGGDRLRLHPLLQAYAHDRLASLPSEARDTLGDAMLAYWVDFAQKRPGFEGMNALETEAHGLMGAVAWARDHARWRPLIDLAYALNQAWDVRGRRAEELRLYQGALEAANKLDDLRQRQWALNQLAVTQAQVGMVSEAREGYVEALALARELNDKAAVRAVLQNLAMLDAQNGNHAQARGEFEEALALARELSDKTAIRVERHELAALDAQSGNVTQARAGLAEALILAHQLGDRRAIRDEIHAAAVLDEKNGNRRKARARFEKALAIARELGDKSAIRAELHSLAVLEVRNKKAPQARAKFEEALALALQLGDVAAQSRELQYLGRLDLDLLDPNNPDPRAMNSARDALEEALRLARHVEQPALVADAARWLAELEQHTGVLEAACEGFREALTIYERLNNPDAESILQRLRTLACTP